MARSRLRDLVLGRPHVCPRWLIRAFDNPLRRLVHDPQALLGPLVRPGQVAVDVGCGIGYFTLPLATLVGPSGRVIAVDLQAAMLEGLRRRAVLAGVASRIQLHQATPGGLGLAEPADFVLAFWMVHEVPDRPRFLGELAGLLRPGGRLLVAEPILHVSRREVERTFELARAAGLELLGRPRVALSRAALFRRPG
jgi:ubiquinone/menaquinone biosynthesis C-methylase UbiE